jgi:putative ABC transport system permease protein
MTLSMGIFSATAARTINRNLEEKVMYMNGSDLVVRPTWWKVNAASGSLMRRNTTRNAFDIDAYNDRYDTMYEFIEPDFNAYKKIDGVESAARIFNWNGIGVDFKSLTGDARLMGIDTDDFAKTTWFRKGLLKYSFYDYLNLLGSERNGCLISKPLSKSVDIKVGDTIQVSRPSTGEPLGDLTVYGIVDYWPSWSPYLTEDNPEGTMPELIITNLSYAQELYHVKPYDIWLKLKPDASAAQVYKDIEKKKLEVTNITNTIEEISEKKNEPNTLTINGSLTLGFIISGIVCFLGFLIYWILSIKSRTLQYGIFRAMGLPVKKLIGMAVFEQLLISAVASVIGTLIGLVTSRLFVPFFQIAIDAKSQIPPFRVSSNSGDRLEIFLIVGIMLLLCMFIIGFILSRIKANQAIKLGEE